MYDGLPIEKDEDRSKEKLIRMGVIYTQKLTGIQVYMEFYIEPLQRVKNKLNICFKLSDMESSTS